MKRVRVGVLVSGSGSNLAALIAACQGDDFPAELVVVVSNVPTAYALERAKAARIPVEVIPHQGYGDRAAFEAELLAKLSAHQVEVVCLAGFMRVLGAGFLSAFPHRVLNIHPSLLPAFPGLQGPRQALAYGAKIAGCTVHLVDAGVDTGPILIQAAVPVLFGDDEAKLAARILAEEHRIYPLALRWLCEGRVKVQGRTVELLGHPVVAGQAIVSPGELAKEERATW